MRTHLDEAYPARLWLGLGAALLGSLQAGYQICVLNTALEHLSGSSSDYVYYTGSQWASLTLLGALIGASSAAWIANRLGPRAAQLINVLLLVLGTALSAFPCWGLRRNQGLIIGRAVSGLGKSRCHQAIQRSLASRQCRHIRLSNVIESHHADGSHL